MEPSRAYDEDPELYSDWGDPREYTIGDMGVGECAGEVVAFVQFGLAAAERDVFEAQIKLDEGQTDAAADLAYKAMLEAAKALDARAHPEPRRRPERDRARVQGAPRRHASSSATRSRATSSRTSCSARTRKPRRGAFNPEQARQRVQEAQLFIEAVARVRRAHGQGSGSRGSGRRGCTPHRRSDGEPMDAKRVDVKLFAEGRLARQASRS